MQSLDVPDLLFQGGRIMAISGKDFIANRHPAAAH
jgi:hypothetical protein